MKVERPLFESYRVRKMYKGEVYSVVFNYEPTRSVGRRKPFKTGLSRE